MSNEEQELFDRYCGLIKRCKTLDNLYSLCIDIEEYGAFYKIYGGSLSWYLKLKSFFRMKESKLSVFSEKYFYIEIGDFVKDRFVNLEKFLQDCQKGEFFEIKKEGNFLLLHVASNRLLKEEINQYKYLIDVFTRIWELKSNYGK